MTSRIEDYALIGDLQTAALVGLDGSIDWLCLPRFDSAAVFARLLGEDRHGAFRISPPGGGRAAGRRYIDSTLVLETDFETADGAFRVTDCMPAGEEPGSTWLIRVVEGLSGEPEVEVEITFRFDYGYTVPWVRRQDFGIRGVAGPNLVDLRTPVALRGADSTTVGRFTVKPGERVPFTLSWSPSFATEPRNVDIDIDASIRATVAWWQEWAGRCRAEGEWREAILRSLITLKALMYAPTGGMVAAPTTSLPEEIGGERNWDYRFCWVRDATITLYAFLQFGYHEEAAGWRDWLIRATAGRPSQLQVLYGVAGERLLPEYEAPWLPGYEGSAPVRIGNAAHEQHQLDIYGELMDVLHVSRRAGIEPEPGAWDLQREILDDLDDEWRKPDRGIWEVRGPLRHFTHSKLMAWVAFDRAVKAVRDFHLDGPADHWERVRDEIRDEIMKHGFDAARNTFVQAYGEPQLDASLMVPLVGFLPAGDPRVVGTVAAIENELMADGFVRRYLPRKDVDGLSGGEGTFLPCTLWYADNLILQGRVDEARAIFERVLAVTNDLGLLAEQYDPKARRQLGNFPQAMTHVALVNTAANLMDEHAPARHRAEEPGAKGPPAKES